MDEVLELLKLKLGISTSKRDIILKNTIESVKVELKEMQGIELDLDNESHTAFLIDYAEFRYKDGEDIPRHLKRLDDVIELLQVEITSDKELNQIKKHKSAEVFCKVDSVSRGEIYNAAITGLRPTYTITMNEFEYSGESEIKYNGQLYSVLRTHKKDDYIELTVGGKLGKID